MRVVEVDKQGKKIKVEIPLTQHTGKIRIKERVKYTDFGIPVATRQKPFNRNMYVEWQIGYDLPIGSSKALLSTLNKESFSFVAYNGERKVLYELSEYLYYFCEMGVVGSRDLEDLINYVQGITADGLIENIYQISKSRPFKRRINGVDFLESEIKYPHLIYEFSGRFPVIAEITIREKQKAVGVQPMLYVCFPVSCLVDSEGKPLLGRPARAKEKATLELDSSKAAIVGECFKIFGMLSKSHRYDTLQILNLIKKNLS